MANIVPDTQLEFDLGADEKPADVTIDNPVEQESEGNQAIAEPASAPESRSAQAEREELDNVSDAVQKRIAKLTARMRESERREQAALEYARGLQQQAQELQQRLVSTDYSRLSETKTRLETQQATLKAIIKKAREEGDVDTETEATQRLTELALENKQVANWLQTQQAALQQPVQQPVMQQPVQQAPQRPSPSPKAEQWAAENTWFGQDREMTYAAWGIHQTLIENEGFDPESDEYYTELNRRIRGRFSDRFQDQPRAQRSAPAVAPATRSSGINSARRTVRLSPSQVAIAKKLNVPLEEYAKYVKE